jgi:Protein of unknown function (DUF3034)
MTSCNPSAAFNARFCCVVATVMLATPTAYAAGDRLLATGGVMQIEGAAGGGLVPWALITGLGTRDQIGASAFCTRVEPQDFGLTSCGLGIGFHDRVEVSIARQTFDLGTTVPGESIRQDVVGAKLRLLGDAVYDQDSWVPQISLGLQYKKNRDFDFVPELLGAKEDTGIDYYVSATKVYLAGPLGRTWLLNATLRATRANQLGILGFGGDRSSRYRIEPELSAGIFLHDHLVLGAEYRAKPDNLSVFREDDFWDGFVAWIPHKAVSLTLAYANLGTIADKADQQGWYGSLQFIF